MEVVIASFQKRKERKNDVSNDFYSGEKERKMSAIKEVKMKEVTPKSKPFLKKDKKKEIENEKERTFKTQKINQKNC